MFELKDAGYSYYRGVPILQNLTLKIPAGMTLVLGPNGSGKSTLLKLAAGVERPDQGNVAIDGHDLWIEEVKARTGLAYIPEQPDLTPYATIDEIIRLVCRLRGASFEEGRNRLNEVDLQSFSRRTVRELSMGQRRRAVLAAAMIGQVRNLVLDEPLEAMDREIREKLLQWIRAHLDAGAAILLATHDVQPFVDLAMRVITPIAGKLTLVEPIPEPRIEFLDKAARGLAG